MMPVAVGGKQREESVWVSPISLFTTLYMLLLGVIIEERETHASRGEDETRLFQKSMFFFCTKKVFSYK